MLNEDYKDILRDLLEKDVRFLVVGAYAMALHGYPRSTGDIDLWVDRSPENSKRIYEALALFGAPLDEITPATFNEEGIIFQIGVVPRRIDIITSADGLEFESSYRERSLVVLEGLHIGFLSRAHLVKNKESTGREKDRLDARILKEKEGDGPSGD